MAEGFANHYGSDVLIATSAGLAPAQGIPPDTVAAMGEMNIDVSQHIPQRYDPFAAAESDIVVNMAGFKLPGPQPKGLVEWQVRDPIGSSLANYRLVRDDLEQRVMLLILELRRRAKQ
jgi:arsenate reductase